MTYLNAVIQAQVTMARGNVSLGIQINVSSGVEGILFEKALTEGALYYKGTECNN